MLVVATQTSVRSPLHLFPFLVFAGAAWLAARLAPGNRRAWVKPESLLEWYTLTVWSDASFIERYSKARAHGSAMRKTSWLTKSGRFARLSVTKVTDATWEAAQSALAVAEVRRF